ncbi:MAG: hypothetical protein LBK61_01380 [Spirochaetaceae bacterium]|jgi:hypothetical protein|nr:hypothetical protein [Spirochaetaceae bacterium]
MPEGFNLKNDGAEQGVPFQQKYEYKICRGAWHEGCGKLFTTDSFISECPECGTNLSHISLSSPPAKLAARIILEKCVKCSCSQYAQKCLGNPKKPEVCRQCVCLKCCMEQSALANEVMKGERTLAGLMMDCVRKRETEEAKAEEAERKAQAERGAVFVETEKKPPSAFKTVGQVIEQISETVGDGEIPLF